MGYTKPIGDLGVGPEEGGSWGSSGATTRNLSFLAGDLYRLAGVTEEGSKAFHVLFAAAVFRMVMKGFNFQQTRFQEIDLQTQPMIR